MTATTRAHLDLTGGREAILGSVCSWEELLFGLGPKINKRLEVGIGIHSRGGDEQTPKLWGG